MHTTVWRLRTRHDSTQASHDYLIFLNYFPVYHDMSAWELERCMVVSPAVCLPHPIMCVSVQQIY